MPRMSGLHCAVLFVLACCFSLTSLSHAGPPKHILLINSYHEGFKGTDDIVDGVRSVLTSVLPAVDIKTEYLDSKNFAGAAYDRKLVDMLRYKYKGKRFDLIVASDDYAFNMAETYYDELFSPSPVVFCGTNNFDGRRLEGRTRFVGVNELPSFGETLGLMSRLQPGLKRIIVIHDDSLVGRINSALFRTDAAAFAGRIEFEYWAGLTLADLAGRVATLAPDTAVFYFASLVRDRSGKSFSSGEALRLLSARSPVPIYGGWEFNLGDGIIGGKLVNLHEHGVAAGRLAARILRGEDPAALPGLSPSPNIFMFDDHELRRFSITPEQLPANSIIINRRPTFYQQNRAEIFRGLSIALAIAVTVFVVVLYRSRSRLQLAYQAQLQADRELRESEASLQRALNEIKTLRGILPICSSCKKIRNDQGAWQQLELYIGEHSDAQFSHGVCPDCAAKLYAEYLGKRSGGGKEG